MDFSKVEAYMKIKQTAIKEEIKQLKKEERELRKAGRYNARPLEKIGAAEKELAFYDIRKVKPVKVDGLVINLKLLEDFVKKIKHLPVDFEVKDTFLLKYPKGRLELLDLSHKYKDFEDFPEVTIFELEYMTL